ncbi:hypothetical protein [Desulfoferrobacter suflitae]|uniref:hypothetical protein n=1 Tax=Desulfoferrobacter suflitae TaxID=2865782 RepID=UPI0021642AE1|nr:hypothetical protein [Desulfoferrobacter suflitae]MCK8604451.1 hypothetical protein [Desulfoferrobacter suflitae]
MASILTPGFGHDFHHPRKELQLDQSHLLYQQEVSGLFGIHSHPDAAKLTCFGLYALQHRGQKGAGIVVSDGSETLQHKGIGLLPEVFTEKALEYLSGHVSLGTVWSSINKTDSTLDLRPFTAYHKGRTISVANNGNLINTGPLRTKLQKEGDIFHSSIS